MAIGKHGDVYTWGTDEFGSLGQGFKWPKLVSRVPESVGVRLVSGAAGWKHTAGEYGAHVHNLSFNQCGRLDVLFWWRGVVAGASQWEPPTAACVQ